MDYYNFNSSSNVIIPEKYTLNAVDEAIVLEYIDAEEYIKKVNELALNDKTVTYTNNNLKYSGIKPKKLKLTIVKGKVISGDITIKEHTFKVESGEVVKPVKEKETN